MASHNHSSPYYTTPSWGVWVFQDAFDLRAFEYHARSMAAAILEAEDEPRAGAHGRDDDPARHLQRDDPASRDRRRRHPGGLPGDFGDHGLVVIRFDDISDPVNPTPIATLVNWGQHPEGLDDHDLITGDFVASLERFVERGPARRWCSARVTSVVPRPAPVSPTRSPTASRKPGRTPVTRTRSAVGSSSRRTSSRVGTRSRPVTPQVPFSSDFDVEAGNAFVPGPLSHPVPERFELPDAHRRPKETPGAPVGWRSARTATQSLATCVAMTTCDVRACCSRT